MFFSNKCQVFLLFGFILAHLKTSVQNSCLTPSKQNGECVPDVNCTVYKNAYDKHFSRNIEYFKKLQCGFNDSFPSICCPKSGDYIITGITLPKEKKHRQRKVFEIGNRFESSADLPGKDVCGIQADTNKIFGGEITELDEFPWMALLFYKRSNQRYKFGCGGALIHDKYVLTAAHCVSGRAYNSVGGLDTVRLGEYNVEQIEDCIVVDDEYQECADAPIDVKHEQIIIYPTYNPDNYHHHHDIALIRLKSTVTYTDFIRPICLPDAENFPEFSVRSGKQMFAAGWGRNDYGNDIAVKLKVKLPVVNPTDCVRTYSRFKINITQSQFCAGGERGKDACKGDSGGPLMIIDRDNWIVSGIVSIGPNDCGVTGIPGVYTNVKYYVSWIKDNVKP